jgi:predicted phage tail protein
MLRNVYLEGELGDKYGKVLQINAKRPAEVFQCMECNFPDFRKYLIDCHEKDIGFTIEVEGERIQAEECLLNLEKGDIIITPIPGGSKSGGAKILAAVAIVGLMIAAPYMFGGANFLAVAGSPVGLGGAIQAGFMASVGTLGGQIALGLAINLALTGMQQLMAPDPSVDSSPEQSYLFNGPEQNIIEGDPVPVLYGRLRVPGQPISFEVLNRKLIDTGTPSIIGDMIFGANTNYSPTNLPPNLGVELGTNFPGGGLFGPTPIGG